MKIILLQDVAKIGKKFEVKNVSDGYAVNFLLPRKLAKMATEQTIKELETEKKKYEEKKSAETKDLKENIGKLKSPVEIKVKANKEGKLFAGLDEEKISQAIQEKVGININPKIIKLGRAIKEVGECKMQIEIGEKKIDLSLNIVAEEK